MWKLSLYHTAVKIRRKIVKNGRSIFKENLQMCRRKEECDIMSDVCWIIEKAKEFQEGSQDCSKAVDCVDRVKLRNVLWKMGISGLF